MSDNGDAWAKLLESGWVGIVRAVTGPLGWVAGQWLLAVTRSGDRRLQFLDNCSLGVVAVVIREARRGPFAMGEENKIKSTGIGRRVGKRSVVLSALRELDCQSSGELPTGRGFC